MHIGDTMKSFGKSKFGKKDSGRSEGRSEGRSYSRPSSGRASGGTRFGRRDSDSSSGSFGGRSRGGSGESFEATCDKCGKKCDLPFKPTGNKPVYCRTCFRDGGDSSSEPRSRSNDFDRSPARERFEQPQSNPSSDELDKINRKIDKIMKALKIE